MPQARAWQPCNGLTPGPYPNWHGKNPAIVYNTFDTSACVSTHNLMPQHANGFNVGCDFRFWTEKHIEIILYHHISPIKKHIALITKKLHGFSTVPMSGPTIYSSFVSSLPGTVHGPFFPVTLWLFRKTSFFQSLANHNVYHLSSGHFPKLRQITRG